MPASSAVRVALARANGGRRPSYWELSRAPRYSLVLALPLLIAYEALAAALASPGAMSVRNGADVILKSPFIAVAGARGPLVFVVGLVGVSIWRVARDARRNRDGWRPAVFAGMVIESAVLALLFGVVVGVVTSQLLARAPLHRPGAVMGALARLGTAQQLMVSLGAGLYEELLFRVVLVSLLLWTMQRVLGWSRWVAATGAAIVGALLFSTAHYVGRFGDVLTLESFVYRAVGGLVFSVLYVTRGFGITAWTHALYDVFLVLL